MKYTIAAWGLGTFLGTGAGSAILSTITNESNPVLSNALQTVSTGTNVALVGFLYWLSKNLLDQSEKARVSTESQIKELRADIDADMEKSRQETAEERKAYREMMDVISRTNQENFRVLWKEHMDATKTLSGVINDHNVTIAAIPSAITHIKNRVEQCFREVMHTIRREQERDEEKSKMKVTKLSP